MEIENVLKELDEAFYDIPFGNSDYQNKTFVMAAELTPARAYRHLGLRLFDRIAAIKELKYQKLLADIDIEEKKFQIEDINTNEFDKRRRKIELDRIIDNRIRTEKMLNDAIKELNCLYEQFKKFPKYSREQFESEEEKHFNLKLSENNSSKVAMGLVKEFDNILIATKEQLLLDKI